MMKIYIVGHINNIYLEGKSDKITTCQNFRQIRKEENREVPWEKMV